MKKRGNILEIATGYLRSSRNTADPYIKDPLVFTVSELGVRKVVCEK